MPSIDDARPIPQTFSPIVIGHLHNRSARAEITITGNVIITGSAGTGKSQTAQLIAGECRARPAALVLEIYGHLPGQHFHVRTSLETEFAVKTRDSVLKDLRELGLRMRTRSLGLGDLAGVLVIDDFPLPDRDVLEALRTLLTYGPANRVHVVVTVPAIPHLLDALSQRCGTWLFLDPAHNHCAYSTLLAPIVRNYDDGHGPMPAGPGSFLLADRTGCSTGQMELRSTGAFT